MGLPLHIVNFPILKRGKSTISTKSLIFCGFEGLKKPLFEAPILEKGSPILKKGDFSAKRGKFYSDFVANSSERN